jgi:hypothetical protein
MDGAVAAHRTVIGHENACSNGGQAGGPRCTGRSLQPRCYRTRLRARYSARRRDRGQARRTLDVSARISPPEQRLYFSDYRDVDGIKLPFRLRRGVGTSTTEETTFDRFRINQKIDPRRFEVRK